MKKGGKRNRERRGSRRTRALQSTSIHRILKSNVQSIFYTLGKPLKDTKLAVKV